MSCSSKVGLSRSTAFLTGFAFYSSGCFPFPLTLSEGGIAGALSHRAFLDLDFLAAGCKRERESDLAGEVDACEAVATFGEGGLARILVGEGRLGCRRGNIVLPFAIEKADLPFEGRNVSLGIAIFLLQVLYLLFHITFGDMKGLILGDDGPRMFC